MSVCPEMSSVFPDYLHFPLQACGCHSAKVEQSGLEHYGSFFAGTRTTDDVIL